ncbi:GD17966 [Drosophila simulans]|uniref:GD17966 n=1 Tax=Drosophila simulans TaxID=7240 RepID=B4NSG7_DROSI|nr:GD17966 [Drosophila simulans]
MEYLDSFQEAFSLINISILIFNEKSQGSSAICFMKTVMILSSECQLIAALQYTIFYTPFNGISGCTTAEMLWKLR